MKATLVRFFSGALALILLIPSTAFAQQASGIAGVARDVTVLGERAVHPCRAIRVRCGTRLSAQGV